MKSKVISFLMLSTLLIPLFCAQAVIVGKTTTSQSNSLKGKILLQVESHGEAWYVNPGNEEKYYLADGNAAFQIMKNLGYGVSNNDLAKIKSDANFRKKFIGKILLQVESHGEAYYISSDGRYNYLQDGAAAFSLMRKLGLGVSNKDLEKIKTSSANSNKKEDSSTNSSSLIPSSLSEIEALEKKDLGDTVSSSTPDLFLSLIYGSNQVFYFFSPAEGKSLYFGLNKTGSENMFYYLNDYSKKAQQLSESRTISDNIKHSAVLSIDLKKVLTDDTLRVYDNDKDGLPNNIEFIIGTDKNAADSNGNKYADAYEMLNAYNPVKQGVMFEIFHNAALEDKAALAAITKTRTEAASRQAVSDIKKIQTALEMYFNENNFYPESLSLILPFLKKYSNTNSIPVSPSMIKNVCQNYQGYKYTRIGDSNPLGQAGSYTLNYCLDVELSDLGAKAGFSNASPSGIR